ncbi:MAG: hypothetical protein ACXW5U_19980 [Thermoanaerobaculia bacterium]
MNLSVRERQVLDAIAGCGSTSLNALEIYFEDRSAAAGGMPADEVRVIVVSLAQKQAVTVFPGHRSDVISITSIGELARTAPAEEQA